MDIFSFLKNGRSPDFFRLHKTICFSGARDFFPLLFFSIFFTRLKKNGEVPIEIVDCAQENMAALHAKLATSFLGSTTLYWFKNVSQLKPKISKQLVQFLKKYEGPNTVAFFVDETSGFTKKDAQLFVPIPEKIDQKKFIKLSGFLGNTVSEKIAQTLFKNFSTINLDAACVLLQYAVLTGKNAQSFVDGWLDTLIEPQHSLNALSSLFFEKKPKQFFVLWSKMSQAYSAQFWIAFWSEQLWRAYNFIEQSEKKQFVEARRISFRLPYKFVNGGWRSVQKGQLRSAHQFLYTIDCSLKNGGSAQFLDLFCSTFFNLN